jgi:hypothetical protein
MARVEMDRTYEVGGSAEELEARLRAYVAKTKDTVRKTDDAIELAGGSQLMTRLIGGWFIGGHNFPRAATVTIADGTVTATIREDLGIGIIDPMFKGKYEKYFAKWLDDLGTALEG